MDASSLNEIIDEILLEMERIWGNEGLGGETKEYAWLKQEYDISEEEDVKWQLALEHHMGELRDEDRDDEEVIAFLSNPAAVYAFLKGLRDKYKRGTSVYPR